MSDTAAATTAAAVACAMNKDCTGEGQCCLVATVAIGGDANADVAAAAAALGWPSTKEAAMTWYCANAKNGADTESKKVTQAMTDAKYTFTFACMAGASKLAVAGAAALVMIANY